MNSIIKIAKNELRNLFYSPIAWFLSIIFMVMCAYFYTSILYPWAKMTFTMYRNKPSLIYWAVESVTSRIFLNPQNGFFINILPHIYLFVPLLTMGIISREFTGGTSKLLFSSPIKLRQIVLGKFLAIITYNLLMVLIIGIFMVSGFFDIKNLDIPPLLSAALGFYLFLCSLTAIGFFMSGLSNYQIVSAIASFTLLFILSRISGLWQEYDFIRDITYFLSISGRTEKMLIGLITTKDILYYLVIIYIFVSFTLIKMKSGRESKPWYIVTGRYIAVVLSGILTGYVGSLPRFTGYLDTTARQVNTIHPRTQHLIRKLNEGPLEVTLYVNLFDSHVGDGLPASRNIYLSTFWEPYQRFKPDMEFRYVYYYAAPDDSTLYRQYPGKSLKQIAGLTAKIFQVDSAMFKSPEEMRHIIDLAPEEHRVVMQLKYKGRTTFLRTCPEGETFWPTEQNMNAAIKRILGEHIPKVYFVQGELERSILKKGEREYYVLALSKKRTGSLLNVGFDADTLNLNTKDIPGDASIVVLADPRMDLSPAAKDKLNKYISQGGNMIISGEPGKQQIVNPLLSHTGVQLMNGQLVQPSFDETPDKIWAYFNPTSYHLSEEYYFRLFKHLWAHKAYGDSLKAPFAGIAALSYTSDSSFSIKPLVETMPGKSWLKAGKLIVDSTPPVFSPQDGDITAISFPATVQLTRQLKGKEQRIVICGDADWASNLRLIDDWARSVYSWVSYNETPVYTPIPYATDNKVMLSPAGAGIQKIVYPWVLPGLMLLMGTVLLIRRKRK